MFQMFRMVDVLVHHEADERRSLNMRIKCCANDLASCFFRRERSRPMAAPRIGSAYIRAGARRGTGPPFHQNNNRSCACWCLSARRSGRSARRSGPSPRIPRSRPRGYSRALLGIAGAIAAPASVRWLDPCRRCPRHFAPEIAAAASSWPRRGGTSKGRKSLCWPRNSERETPSRDVFCRTFSVATKTNRDMEKVRESASSPAGERYVG